MYTLNLQDLTHHLLIHLLLILFSLKIFRIVFTQDQDLLLFNLIVQANLVIQLPQIVRVCCVITALSLSLIVMHLLLYGQDEFIVNEIHFRS